MNSISSILRVDSCTDFQLPECKLSEPENSKEIALQRVLRHREAIVKVNPVKEKENIDKALRATLTYMMTIEETEKIPNGSEVGLKYIKERINIPRDMPIWSARRLREALGETQVKCWVFFFCFHFFKIRGIF